LYTFKINTAAGGIASLEIDPSLRMADVDRKNNKINIQDTLKPRGKQGK